jgi:ketosteroid isomerase-like protein
MCRYVCPNSSPLLVTFESKLPLADVCVHGMLDMTARIKEAHKVVDTNIDFVKGLFAAFGRGDIGYVIDAHSDDVVSESPVSHTSTLPWAGTRAGRRELAEYFETIAAHLRPEAFQNVVFTASGDRVVVEGTNAGSVVETG